MGFTKSPPPTIRRQLAPSMKNATAKTMSSRWNTSSMGAIHQQQLHAGPRSPLKAVSDICIPVSTKPVIIYHAYQDKPRFVAVDRTLDNVRMIRKAFRKSANIPTSILVDEKAKDDNELKPINSAITVDIINNKETATPPSKINTKPKPLNSTTAPWTSSTTKKRQHLRQRLTQNRNHSTLPPSTMDIMNNKETATPPSKVNTNPKQLNSTTMDIMNNKEMATPPSKVNTKPKPLNSTTLDITNNAEPATTPSPARPRTLDNTWKALASSLNLRNPNVEPDHVHYKVEGLEESSTAYISNGASRKKPTGNASSISGHIPVNTNLTKAMSLQICHQVDKRRQHRAPKHSNNNIGINQTILKPQQGKIASLQQDLFGVVDEM